MNGREKNPDDDAFDPIIRARHRVLHDLYAPSQERKTSMNEQRDFVYADCMAPVPTTDDIDLLISELNKADSEDIDLFVVGIGVFGLLRRLQMAENQSKLNPAARDYFNDLQRVGLFEGDAR